MSMKPHIGICFHCGHDHGTPQVPDFAALAAPSQPAEPVLPSREAEERRNLAEHFANRKPSPASADFDLPAPNDPIEPVAQAQFICECAATWRCL